MLRTRLTEMFALERPIVLAPLANGATSGHLAAAVSAAGGLGLFGGIHAAGAEWVREQIRFLRTGAHRRWGVGFITCRIADSEANFQACLDEHAPVIAFSFGDPTEYVVRAKAMGASPLEEVAGVGAQRKKALLAHFGSAKGVSSASLADLEAVEGVSHALARRIFDFFHPD